MQEVVETLAAHHEGRHDLAAVDLLGLPGDGPGLDEVEDGIGEELGVDAEIALRSERERYGGRNGADAHLERRPVRDQLGHVLADATLDVADNGERVLVRRLVHLNGKVDLVDVDERVAQGSRHRAVELRHDRGGRLDRRQRRVDAGSE